MTLRRALLVGSIALLAAPGAVAAPPARMAPRIGILRLTASSDPEIEAFRQRLRELGYVEGQNIVIEQPAAKSYEDLAHVAAELVRLKVEAILAPSTQTARVARETITTIPVVFVTFADPVRVGLVASLARPGRNMTGVTMMSAQLAGKRLELLKEAFPKVARVAVLWNPANQDTREQLNETQSAARSLGVQLEVHTATVPQELDGAFAVIGRAHADAFFVLSDTMFFRERRRIAGLAEKSRLPGIYHWRAYVDAGGLMSYGPNLTDLHRQAAGYVDRILRGAKPGELPIEQPTKFELVINLKTARALGRTIPPSLRLRASEVIE